MRNRYLMLGLAVIILACVRPGYAAEPDEADMLDEAPLVTEPSPGEMAAIPPNGGFLSQRLCGCCQPTRPAWYFQADALAIRREVSSDRVFAALGQATWTEIENPDYEEPPDEGEDTRSDLEKATHLWEGTVSFTTALALRDADVNRFQGGGRLLLGRTLGRNNAMEVSYFDLADWRGTAVVTDEAPFIASASRYGNGSGVLDSGVVFPGSLFSPLSGFGKWIDREDLLERWNDDPTKVPEDVPFDGNNWAEIRYSSSLNNLEWNVRHWVVRVPGYFQASLLLGGRYMNVDEMLYYYTQRDPFTPEGGDPVGETTTSVTVDTHNPMLGVQVGGTYEVAVTPGWWLDCKLKGVLLSNNASQSTLFVHEGVNDGYQDPGHLEHAKRNGIASAVDATFTTRFALSRRVAFHLSYQILYVNGLALASDNFCEDPDVLLSGPASVATNGEVLYHGAHVGLTCVW